MKICNVLDFVFELNFSTWKFRQNSNDNLGLHPRKLINPRKFTNSLSKCIKKPNTSGWIIFLKNLSKVPWICITIEKFTNFKTFMVVLSKKISWSANYFLNNLKTIWIRWSRIFRTVSDVEVMTSHGEDMVTLKGW